MIENIIEDISMCYIDRKLLTCILELVDSDCNFVNFIVFKKEMKAGWVFQFLNNNKICYTCIL